jgi:hypothetical protein
LDKSTRFDRSWDLSLSGDEHGRRVRRVNEAIPKTLGTVIITTRPRQKLLLVIHLPYSGTFKRPVIRAFLSLTAEEKENIRAREFFV